MEDCSVETVIRVQGAPLIDEAYIISNGDGIVAIRIDMKSKYTRLLGTYSSNHEVGIILAATKSSLYLNEEVGRGAETQIQFPEYKGYSVHCASSSRYTVNVCLIKQENE